MGCKPSRCLKVERGAEILRRGDSHDCARYVCSGARPSHQGIIRYADAHRDQFGVEWIGRCLSLAVAEFMTSRGYRAPRSLSWSHRVSRDQVPGHEIVRPHLENRVLCLVRKMHHLMRCQGCLVGCDLVGRVIRARATSALNRGLTTFTTTSQTNDSSAVERV